MTPLSDPVTPVLELAVELSQLLGKLRATNTGDLQSRELSLAITNIEQGSHWLRSLIRRLSDTAPEAAPP